MIRYWPIAVVVLVFLALGAANIVTARSGKAEAAAANVQEQLDAMPKTIGGWSSEPVTVPERQLKGAEAEAYLSRLYTRDRTTLSVLLLYGKSGPLGAHTPEVCYEGAGYRRLTTPAKVNIRGTTAEFLTAKFETGSFPPATVSVVWGWGDGKSIWKGSENARLDFVGHDRIYKLYVNRTVPLNAATDKDPTDEFLGAFLKELNDTLAKPVAPKG